MVASDAISTAPNQPINVYVLGNDRDPEGDEHVAHQVVRHRPLRRHALERERDGGRLGRPDEDRQGAPGALDLLEQHHRVVGR